MGSRSNPINDKTAGYNSRRSPSPSVEWWIQCGADDGPPAGTAAEGTFFTAKNAKNAKGHLVVAGPFVSFAFFAFFAVKDLAMPTWAAHACPPSDPDSRFPIPDSGFPIPDSAIA
jgi:hypothetical protein